MSALRSLNEEVTPAFVECALHQLADMAAYLSCASIDGEMQAPVSIPFLRYPQKWCYSVTDQSAASPSPFCSAEGMSRMSLWYLSLAVAACASMASEGTGGVCTR